MSSLPTASALNADSQIWPFLMDAEIGRARPYGRVRQAELGEILYRPGDDQELINLSSLKYFFAVGGTAALLSREML
jgi:hypothetical protein